MLSKISEENLQKEQEIVEKLFRNIDNKKSTLFNAGAGSGKTYALVECLKYVIKTYGKILSNQNQMVICITYTNVAADEIKQRLRNTNIIRISTIHERIWDFINCYQKELVEIHLENLKLQITLLNKKCNSGKEFYLYRQLSNESKLAFEYLMMKNKELYYKNYGKNATDFKNAFTGLLVDFSPLLKNVANFKKIVDTLFKIKNYQKCIENIIEKKDGYKEITYNILYNRDQLHRMRISHDTLLEYGFQMMQKYDLLKQFVIDKYPFMFIDEYQDTNEKVVKIINMLQKYAESIKHNIFVGYFGDSVQNIYEDGIGKQIEQLHPGLEVLEKNFNRRSAQEIIDVANKIRNDEIIQNSIYEDCHGGNIEFYSGKESDVTNFIEKNAALWNISKDDSVHCFMLTNKLVAQFSGFEKMYSLFSNTGYYKTNYQQLNTELLSDEPSKLGEIPQLLFRIVSFINNIQNVDTPLTDILPYAIYAGNSVGQLKDVVDVMTRIEGRTLQEYVTSIEKLYKQNKNENYKKVIEGIFDNGEISIENMKGYMIRKLYPDIIETELEEASKSVSDILEIDIQEYNKWYEYILRKTNSNVIYHTYHGTKGLEFDNVLVIMGNAFGRINNYFNYFFNNYGNSNQLDDNNLKRYEQARNLLYVSITRTIKNLKVLYIDDVSDFSGVIEDIFGKIKKFDN